MVLDEVAMLHEFWSLNVLSVPTTPSDLLAGLTDNARFILQQLYDGLIRPIAPHLSHFEHLIFVPHAQLHYLPLHALHDGTHYLIEQHSVSYLPSASVLPFCTPPEHASASCIMGYSLAGQLPFTVNEATQIAAQFNTEPLLESLASIQSLPNQSTLRLLHLATHGDFRADNPLFSGLTLADGQLTTLDIFNLRLEASLVTLSACQTGLDVVGGGDELLGLARAFLYAGAASLLLSRWQVHDEATARLLQHFYERLLAGETKAVALQQAQLATMKVDSAETHPYFWAAFVLVGHIGTL